MSGAVKRCLIFLRQQTSAGRQAHRWPVGKRMRPEASGWEAREQAWERREEEERLGMDWCCGDGFFFCISLIFFISFVITSPVRLAVTGDEEDT